MCDFDNFWQAVTGLATFGGLIGAIVGAVVALILF